LVFDQNAITQGTAITHTAGSANIVINQTGLYRVSFNGTLAPTKDANLPLSITLSLKLQGVDVPGGAALQIFHTSLEGENVAFSQFVRMPSVPSTLTIVATGGAFLYSLATILVERIGDGN